jgi:hypothetical protein
MILLCEENSMDNTQQPFISDESKPNSGRIYDYLLGGHHYFDVDKKAAKQVLQYAPFAPKLARLIRWFLGVGIRKAIERGFTQFIDFASGLPTVDHIHSITPEGTKVIYSDIDPITVEYAKDIIQKTSANSMIKYEICNAANPETLLNSNLVKSIIDKNQKVAVGFNGICYFLTDEQINHSMKVLYEWAAEGSILFLTDLSDNESEDVQTIVSMYKNMGQFLTGGRPKENLMQLVKPWRIEEPGFLTLEEWIGVNPTVTDEIIKSYGGGEAFGVFLIK